MLTVADAAAQASARAAGELDGMLRAYHASAGCHGSLWMPDGASVSCRSASRAPRPAPRADFPRPGPTDDPTADHRLEREDGRGLFLMRRLMDRVERFPAVPRGNVVRLTLRRR